VAVAAVVAVAAAVAALCFAMCYARLWRGLGFAMLCYVLLCSMLS
jgi:hypothetical protein